jgi:hypothetical protein
VDVDVVADKSNDRRYFTVVPNIVDDSELDPFAFRLYVHLKRVAGETGRCTQSTSTLATACKMSRPVVVDAKKTLVEKGLITIELVENRHGGRPYHEITIVDIWQENITSFAGQGSVVDLPSSRDLPCKVNDATLQGSVVERKKNPNKKNPIRRTKEQNEESRKAREPTVDPKQTWAVFAAYCEGLGIDPRMVPESTKNGDLKVAAELVAVGYTPEMVRAATEAKANDKWWKNKEIRLRHVAGGIAQRNGGKRNGTAVRRSNGGHDDTDTGPLTIEEFNRLHPGE